MSPSCAKSNVQLFVHQAGPLLDVPKLIVLRREEAQESERESAHRLPRNGKGFRFLSTLGPLVLIQMPCPGGRKLKMGTPFGKVRRILDTL